jgi:hypothetical protein
LAGGPVFLFFGDLPVLSLLSALGVGVGEGRGAGGAAVEVEGRSTFRKICSTSSSATAGNKDAAKHITDAKKQLLVIVEMPITFIDEHHKNCSFELSSGSSSHSSFFFCLRVAI